jgi:hypothetical protein
MAFRAFPAGGDIPFKVINPDAATVVRGGVEMPILERNRLALKGNPAVWAFFWIDHWSLAGAALAECCDPGVDTLWACAPQAIVCLI